MKPLSPEFKIARRSRPAMGTFLTIDCPSLTTACAFDEAERIEKIFSLYKQDSIASRFNRASFGDEIMGKLEELAEFLYLVRFALDLNEASDGAFDPFVDCKRPVGEFFSFYDGAAPKLRKLGDARLDLNGIAKGYAVDCVAKVIERFEPTAPYSINAGGDLRIGGGANPRALLRLGTDAQPVTREISLLRAGLATSSSDSAHPSTHYRGTRVSHAAAAMAASCAVADALTKVGLFGKVDAVARCARRFDAVILTFDTGGNLLDSFGDA